MMRAGVALVAMLACCNENRETVGDKTAGTGHATVTARAPLAPADEAKDIADSRCAMCHGKSGKGDGPNGMTLSPKPQDLSTKDWQKSVSDAQVRSVILKGGGAVGKSPLMPSNPDLESKPAVVDELVKIVRGYGAP
ncbi:MAG TPA: c-type cytochrome [Polyangiaceae bacterium]|jgi:cytochrome c553|nr:c-type cytochrome [Polyangiaceae bacterium]